MSDNFYDNLMAAWARQCVYYTGDILPINRIDENLLEYRVDDEDDPLILRSGTAVRAFTMPYNFLDYNYEQTTTN